MKIAITSESTHDLPKEYVEKYNIKTIPFTVYLGDEEKKDGVDITPEIIFDHVKKTGILPKTTALNEFEYTEFFESVLNEGYDALIHIALSSGLSSTCSHAIDASKKMKNVYVIDSHSLSTGIGVQVLYAAQLRETISDPKEIVKLVEERKSSVQTSFIVERLDYLHKGGRCSGFQLLGANILKIRPRLVLKDGKMVNDDKSIRGQMPMAVKKYCQGMLAKYPVADDTIVFVTYSSATPEMKDSATAVLKEAGIENIVYANAGSTITSHCGENTLGIIYYTK